MSGTEPLIHLICHCYYYYLYEYVMSVKKCDLILLPISTCPLDLISGLIVIST